MKVNGLTVRYAVKRTAEYQCAEVGAELVVSLEDGDKICDLYRAGLKKLVPMVDEEADAAIRELRAASRRMMAG